MSYKVKPTEIFQRQFKRLFKRYNSLKSDINKLGEQLLQNPTLGNSLGKNCYKVRLQISSKAKGKSGGARVITHIHVVGEIIYLLSIYDKSEKENLDEKELDSLLSEIRA